MQAAPVKREVSPSPEAEKAAQVDINARDEAGNTPLHKAAWNGHAEAVEVLLKHGADPNARSTASRTPLDLAIQADSLPAVKALLDGGANPNAPGGGGMTPLQIAHRRMPASKRAVAIGEALLAAGADREEPCIEPCPLDIGQAEALDRRRPVPRVRRPEGREPCQGEPVLAVRPQAFNAEEAALSVETPPVAARERP